MCDQIAPAPALPRRTRYGEQHLHQPLLFVDGAREKARARNRDRTGLLGNDEYDGIGLFGQAERGPMTRTETACCSRLFRKRQETCRCFDA
ncbi:MAG TPA: hypothetical protein VKE42_09935, partial [Candidatus Cybelea sp.]|nr:hypothetical protein [Candidatus Cybelea sp.]